MGLIGSVLGGAITLCGVLIATRNVNRQLRVNLISREEERIEEQLPGLEQVRDNPSPIGGAAGPTSTIRWLEKFREVIDLSDVPYAMRQQVRQMDRLTADRHFRITQESIKYHMPLLVDVALRRRVATQLTSLHGSALALRTNYKTGTGLEADEFEREKRRFDTFVQEVEKKITLYEERRAAFRAEIERYFEP
jgi:hypothetical protein